MKKVFRSIEVMSFLLIFASLIFGQTNISKEQQGSRSGMITLYALDPLASSLCFQDGKEGSVVQYNEIRNRCSDIDFNRYFAGNFTTGVEGGRVGTIIDLGSGDDLKLKYGYSESSLSKGLGFVSLRLENQKIVLLKDRNSFQDLKEADQLFRKGSSLASVPVKLGHNYLLRITDTFDKSFEILAKMVVIAYRPDESVTIRWQVISNEKPLTPGN